MSLEKGKERYKRSLIVPLAFANAKLFKWILDIDEAESAKDEDFDPDDMVVVAHVVLDEDGTQNIHYEARNTKTGESCGELNDSRPCPPFPPEECYEG